METPILDVPDLSLHCSLTSCVTVLSVVSVKCMFHVCCFPFSGCLCLRNRSTLPSER